MREVKEDEGWTLNLDTSLLDMRVIRHTRA